MTISKRPVVAFRDQNQLRRDRETINGLLDHSLDDYRRRTTAEVLAGVTPINTAYPPGDVRRYGATGDGVTDDTVALQAAHNQGKQDLGARPYLASGEYLISTSIDPCRLGMYGDGPANSALICNGCHGFTVPSNAGWDRPSAVFEKFRIDSNNGTSCDARYAFYFPGVASGAAAVYNIGFTARDIEIGRYARMGGGFFLKDVFRANVENIGMTDVSRMIKLVGSVAQSKFVNVTSNNDSQATEATTDADDRDLVALYRRGISTESASYASETLAPENIRFIDCSYIRGTRGISHAAGFVIEFENFDCEADAYGAHINAICTMRGGILSVGTGATAWTGIFRGVNVSSEHEATVFYNVDINCLRTPGTPSSSYHFDAGDNVSPVRGLVIKECRFRGVDNAVQSAFRGRILSDCTFVDNFIRTSSVTGTNDVDITSASRLRATGNRNPSGVWSITDGGDADAYGEVKWNYISTLSFSPTSPHNWDIGKNETIATAQNVHEVGTFTATLTGCTTSPTVSVRYLKNGRFVTLYIPSLTGTSNTTSCTFTGVPATIQPNRIQVKPGRYTDNGADGIGLISVDTGGSVTLYNAAGTSTFFTNSGTKGFPIQVHSYSTE